MKSLRARITLVSTIVLAVVLALAAVVIVTLVERQLRNDLDDQNERTLNEIAALIADGSDPATLRLPIAADGTEFSIATMSGDWINSTVIVTVEEGTSPVGVDDYFVGADEYFTSEIFPSNDAGTTSSVEATAPDGRRYTVEAFAFTSVVDRTAGQVATVLWIVIPALAAVFGGMVWLLTGRVLRPVDRITSMARRIRTETLHERIDEPGTNDEIDRLAKTLNGMLERLDQGARSQQQFVSDASHELQSPLTVLLGESELALSNPTPDRLLAANELVVEHGQRMLSLIRDLLDLARADEAGLRRVDVDLDDLLRTAAATRTSSRYAIDTRAVSPARVTGDERSLARAFNNLIDNALRYGAGRVELSCRLDDGYATITVDDDGPGIPEEHRLRVFDRFVRLDDSRSRADGGTGLGLAIVDAIVTEHGGSAEVSDSPLGGARFTVRLPTAV